MELRKHFKAAKVASILAGIFLLVSQDVSANEIIKAPLKENCSLFTNGIWKAEWNEHCDDDCDNEIRSLRKKQCGEDDENCDESFCCDIALEINNQANQADVTKEINCKKDDIEKCEGAKGRMLELIQDSQNILLRNLEADGCKLPRQHRLDR